MKVTQQYFSAVGAILVLALLLPITGERAGAAARSRITPVRGVSDPILTGPAWGPCASEVFSPGYVAGIDAYGHPVAPADLAGNITAAIPSDVVVPEVFTRNRNVGRVAIPVEIPGLAEASAPPLICAPHHHREKG